MYGITNVIYRRLLSLRVITLQYRNQTYLGSKSKMAISNGSKTPHFIVMKYND
jgi:hypothetical protein